MRALLVFLLLSLSACSQVIGLEHAKDRVTPTSSAGAAGSSSGASAGGDSGSAGTAGDSGSGGMSGSAGEASDPCVGVACSTPPPTTCQDANTLIAFDPIGSCDSGTCSYVSHTVSCNCQNGACTTDPCLGVTCDNPATAACTSDGMLTQYQSGGTCIASACHYPPATTSCQFGCAFGKCNPDPCLAQTCMLRPNDSCQDDMTLLTHENVGSCSDGSCSYPQVLKTCPNGCSNGACNADPCAGVTCTAGALNNSCQSPTQAILYDPMGSCSDGQCSYHSQIVDCTCSAGACTTDPCAMLKCTSPPTPSCTDANTRRTYGSPGQCSSNGCSYAPTDTTCSFGCANGACVADPCKDVICMKPPSPSCSDDALTTYASGVCKDGVCGYAPNAPKACQFGCAAGACLPDPCQGVMCMTQQPATCAGVSTVRTFSASGACAAGQCSYPHTDTPCSSNTQCSSGACVTCAADASCGTSCTACSGSTPHCLASGSTSQCVQCLSNTDCATNACVAGTCSGVCRPGATRCDSGGSNGVQTCTGSGQWGAAVACAGQTCMAGQCQGACASGQPCGAASCASDSQTAIGSCDASGTCRAGAQTGCAPYQCDTSACKTGCSANTDCVGGDYCNASGACVPCTADAHCGPNCLACAGASPRCSSVSSPEQCVQCLSNADCPFLCTNGVCTGVCKPNATRCDAAGSNGLQTCDGTGQWGAPMACSNQTCQSGKCQGTCAVGTACGTASCTSGTGTTLGSCDTTGACKPGSTTPCAPFVCGATSCKTSCTSKTDCVSGDFCWLNRCVTATQIAAGGEHICALTSAGTVQCWGDDSSGQLGYDPSTFTNPGVPMPVNGLPAGVTAITAGSSHTCALATDGSVWCWGSCQFGEIGGGCTSASFTPIKVLSGATSIAAGGAHTCAVLTGGGAQCWGQNNYGQLGFGSSNSSIPLTVKSASVPAGSSLAAGQYHNCVLNSTGVIACWGSDMFGELGGVTTLSPISAVTAGTFSTCALSQGGAYCRGRNSVGQLGNGVSDGPSSTTTHPGFTSVIGLTSGVTAIASGDDHVCAVDSNTTVECWGDFRTNAMAYVNATPIMVTGATALAAGSVFSCAVTSTGLWCWGRGTNGELGDGTFMTNDLPVQVMEP